MPKYILMHAMLFVTARPADTRGGSFSRYFRWRQLAVLAGGAVWRETGKTTLAGGAVWRETGKTTLAGGAVWRETGKMTLPASFSYVVSRWSFCV